MKRQHSIAYRVAVFVFALASCGSAVASALPAGYAALEYIESSGSQYIDTGYKPNGKTTATFKYRLLKGNQNRNYVFGYCNVEGVCRFQYSPPGSGCIIGHDSWNTLNSLSGIATDDFFDHTVTMGPDRLLYDGYMIKAFSAWNNANTSRGDLCIFGNRIDTGTPSNLSSIRLYRLTLSEDGVAVHDYVPCLRKADNVAGLYDLAVTDGTGFRANQNTAAGAKPFVAGKQLPPCLVSGVPEPYEYGGRPRYGQIEMSAGDAVELSAPEMVETAENERAYCMGWKLYDGMTDGLIDESTDETRLTCAFTYETPVRLVWQWKMRYRVTASAAEGLSAAVSPEWVWAGEKATFRATDSGKTFAKWIGGVPSDLATKRTFSITVTAPLSFRAVSTSSSVLPAGYVEVEYIESSGSQYIDTGYKPNGKTTATFKYRLLKGNQNRNYVLGYCNVEGVCRFQYSPPGSGIIIGYDNWNTLESLAGIAKDDFLDHAVTMGPDGLLYDGKLLKTFPRWNTANTSRGALCIFSNRIDTGAPSTMSSIRLYGLTLEDGSVFHDYVPCLRKTDNVAGLYDLSVTDGTGFLANQNAAAGAEPFIAGKPINGCQVSGDPEPYGAAGEPVYGLIEMSAGENARLTAPESVQVSATKRAVCAGWKLYNHKTGELVAESTDRTRLTCAFVYETPVRLVWQWDVRYPVTVSAAPGLTVTPATAWGSATTPVEFTVEGTDFPFWSGEGLLSEPHAKRAVFAPTAATEATVTPSDVRKPTSVEDLVTSIASSVDGDVIVLPDGTHSFANVTLDDMTNGLALTKGILVTSRSGDPKDVTVDLGGTGHGFTLKATGARLKGITFTSSANVTDSEDLTLPRFVNIITGTVDTCVFRDIALGKTANKGAFPVLMSAAGAVTGCLFTNIAGKAQDPFRGSVVRATGGLISNTKFIACNTYQSPVYATGASSLFVEDCLFTGVNSAGGTAGAICAAFMGAGVSYAIPTVIARRTVVANNTVPGSGAVAAFISDSWNLGGVMNFEDCLFTNNVANGGCGCFELVNRSYVVCDRCVIADNVGATRGVCSAGQSCCPTFRNCLIRGNTGRTGAGVAFGNDVNYRIKFENCTVVGNRTESGGASAIGIRGCGSAANTWIKNCIVWGNTGADLQLQAEVDKVFNSCHPEAEAGNVNGNVAEDPKFRKVRRYRNYPSPDGPCYETGNPTGWTADDVDLAGKPRLRNGKIDMGCYQAEPLPGLMLMVK